MPWLGAAACRANDAFDVRSFGARGDAHTDDTSSIQAAVDAAIKAKRPLQFPPTEAGYAINQITVTGSISLDLGGSRLFLQGQNAGFFVSGSVSDLSIQRGIIVGDHRLASNHHAVLMSSVRDMTSTYDRFVASDLTISGCVGGLVVGCIRDAHIARVHILDTVGQLSGTGYGIGMAKGSLADCYNILVEDCTFTRTTRHGLYIGGARNVTLRNLEWHDHAMGETSTHGRSALAISRSQNVTGCRLLFRDCADECIGIDDDEGGYTMRGAYLSGVTIENAHAVAIRIGVATEWIDGITEVSDVLISNLVLRWISNPKTYPVLIQEARHVTIRDVQVSTNDRAIGGILRLVSGQAAKRSDVVIEQIRAELPKDEYLVTVPKEVALGSTSVVVRDLECTCAVPVAYEDGVAPTNPNLRVLYGVK